MMIRIIKKMNIHLFHPSLLYLSMCVAICYDISLCVNGFLFRSLVRNNVPVHVAVCARIITRNECFDTHLQQKRERRMELMFLVHENVKNICSKVAAAWI